MFKSARWRSEKNKITAVFKLRFHATQAAQLGSHGLVLSLVPVDTGKPTAKLETSTVQDGCCYWENAVHETVKFLQDPKTGKLHERIYNFIISTSSPKSSFVGEASVNIAEYFEATKAATVSLPFKSTNCEGVLHVLIQRVEATNASPRDLEENGVGDDKSADRSLKRHFSNGDAEVSTKSISTEEEPLRKTMSHIAGLNGDHRTSSGSDITLSSSDGSSGLNTPRDLGTKSDGINQAVNAAGWGWSLVPAHESSTEDSVNSPRDASLSGRSHLGPDESVGKLKADIVVLARKVEVSELELQTLRKQIVKESKRGQDLSRQVASIKEERDALHEECEHLKASQKHNDESRARSKRSFEGDPVALLEEIRQELDYEKTLNFNLRLQLQKTQESNSELILAVQDLEQMLQESNREDREEIDPSTRPANLSSDDEEQKALEDLVRQHTDAKEAYLLEQKIMDLCSEIEMYRRDKDELEMQMEQLALDYEILKQENHEMSYKLEQSQLQEQLKLQYECSGSYIAINELESQIERLENELNIQSRESSNSLATIKELETHILNLEEELEKQGQRYNADLEAITSVKIEQEVKLENLENELDNHSKTIHDLQAKITKLMEELEKQAQRFKTHILNLEEELEKQGQRYNTDLEAVTSVKIEQEVKIENLESELDNQSKTIHHLEAKITKLKEELEKQAQQFEAVTRAKVEQALEIEKLEIKLMNNSSATIKDLEAHILDLEEELVKQAQGFEADLEALTGAKVEQEQRAIRAEEALRLTRWKNVNTAERLQEDFRRLSTQMQSTFEANEKLATKALTEASELRLRNSHLEEMLQNAAEELQAVKDEYEAKLHELNDQIKIKSTQINQMMVENEEKSKHEIEVSQALSMELEKLRDDIANLQTEADELRHSLEEEELVKEKLRKQVFQLKADLKKKEDALTSMERKLKDNNGRATITDRTKATPKSNAKEVSSLKEKIRLLEEQIKSKEGALDTSTNAFLEKEKELHIKIVELEGRLKELDQSSTTLCEVRVAKSSMPASATQEQELLKEVALLKEKNTSMESELKEMQGRYSEISLRFAEVEGERQQLVMSLRNLKNAKKS